MFNVLLPKNQAARSLKIFTNCLSTSSKRTVVAIPLKSKRALIKVSGEKTHDFLQGLITNDIRHLDDGLSVIYSMFLNTKGRVLYDSLIYKTPRENEYLLECDTQAVNSLCKHLAVYRVRRKITIEPQVDLVLWNLHSPTDSFEDTNSSIIPDPRTKLLGSRLLLEKAQDPQTLTSHLEIEDINVYEKLRYQLGISEGIEDLPPGKALPLESNCDYLHGVSFHKGCYLGQELTARTHHTGVIRKRLMPLQFLNPCDSPVDTAVQDSNQKAVGKLRSLGVNNFGLGLIHLSEALAQDVLYVDGKVPAKTYKPDWWPIEAPKDNQHKV